MVIFIILKKIRMENKTIKINFEKLKLTSLSGEVLIYSGANGIGYKLLAEKIYKSKGEVELDENEGKLLVHLLDSDFFTNKLTDAIRDCMK